ncbi:hypothetical protein K4F52_006642 [Lecanicillium sp. MT-2017a]|nr:hypothetical protein K4F52_006642 [Lecanicillium sp. MT-2017a]
MDHSLTCNNLKCRAELSDRALVTTCSHIFCLECANRQFLLQCDAHNRASCPACGTELSSAEDAAVTNLRPTEAYKTSILSGLSPSTIMECAGRALSFWAYQTTQEICYQQYLYKTLTDKYSALSVRLDQVVKEANAEIDGLQGKLAAVTIEQDNAKKKSEELAKAYKEKSRKLVQTQESYDRLKRRVEMGHIQRAASDAVDSRIHAKPADGSHSIDLLQPNGQQHQQHQHQQHQPYPAAPQLQVNRPGAPDNSRFQANNSSSHAAINPPNYWQYDTPMPIVIRWAMV